MKNSTIFAKIIIFSIPHEMLRYVSLLLLFCSYTAISQVKVGDNPSQINSSSLLELESTTKAFVLNRLTSIQMEAINPLQGAMVYNIDEQCVFVFEGSNWKNLCNASTSVTTSENAPTNNNEGDIWVNNSENRDVMSIWDGTKWIPINNNPKSGIGEPTQDNPENPLAGDIYINENSGELYTYNGLLWLKISSEGGGVDDVTVNNGLSRANNGDVQFGGDLIQPTEIRTDPTNTLAIIGLEDAVIDDETEVVTINKNTGQLQKVPLSALNREVQEVTTAVDGQTQFTTPYPVTDIFKIYVYRNGVRLGFTKVDDLTIELESGVFCYQDDEIRIVQKY